MWLLIVMCLLLLPVMCVLLLLLLRVICVLLLLLLVRGHKIPVFPLGYCHAGEPGHVPEED